MFENTHSIVVGGGSGIGKAIASAIVKAGGKVTITSRSAEKLDAAAQEIKGDIHTAPVDMTNANAVKEWAKNLGSVDHLVISASNAVHGPFEKTDVETIRPMFDAKFFGPYTVAHAVLTHMNDNGSITFFSGILSRRPGMNCSGLGAVNSAVEGLTRGLALELGPKIRVNCMSPGMVRSEAYEKLPEDAREEMYRSTGESLPVGRVGTVDEIAHAVLMLMTNTYTTGIVLDVDGGNMVRQYASK